MFDHKFRPGDGPQWTECQHPECGIHISQHVDKMDAIAKRTMETIIKHGHQVTFVFPHKGDDSAQFWYSTGRSLKYKPEFLLTGPLPSEVGMFIINQAAAFYDEHPFRGGDQLPSNTLLNGYPVRIIEADPIAAEMFGATSNFDDVTALQIVWPDMNGRFPGEPGYAYTDDVQPLYPKMPA